MVVVGVTQHACSPALGLDSPGAGPVELERGGILLLLEFFSMVVPVKRGGLGPSSGQRAAELSSIKRENTRGKRTVARAAKATKARMHFFPTRRPHHGDMLTTDQGEKKKRHDRGVSSATAAGEGVDERRTTRGQDPRKMALS